MSKPLFQIILILLISFSSYAQRFEVTSFKQDPADPSANMYAVQHFNGEYCALIKVLTNANNLSFETTPDLEKFEKKKPGEFWVYVPPGIKRIVIRKDGFIPKEYTFASNINIQSKLTYVMELEANMQNTEEEAPQPEFVLINSTPKGASVYIKNPVSDEFEYKGKTPYQAPMLEGEYEYKLKKDFHLDYSGILKVKPGATINEDITLKANFGTLTINSNPESDAGIILNGKKLNQKTPYTISNVPVGENIIEVEKEFFEPSKQTVNISPGDKKELTFQLKPIFGTVTITCDSKTEIYVDNQKVSTGTYTGRLTSGVHIIEARQNNHHPHKQTVTINKGEEYSYDFNLKPKTGIISVMTTPPGAEIFLDGKSEGKSPKFIRNALIGNHSIKLVLKGYEDVVKQITVTEGQTVDLNISLNKQRKDNTVVAEKKKEQKSKDLKSKKTISDNTNKKKSKYRKWYSSVYLTTFSFNAMNRTDASGIDSSGNALQLDAFSLFSGIGINFQRRISGRFSLGTDFSFYNEFYAPFAEAKISSLNVFFKTRYSILYKLSIEASFGLPIVINNGVRDFYEINGKYGLNVGINYKLYKKLYLNLGFTIKTYKLDSKVFDSYETLDLKFARMNIAYVF